MDTAELRVFLAVAELGNLSQASARLGLPQPTLSRQIDRLEEDLGGPLFNRLAGDMSLTPMGQQLCEQAAPLVGGLDRARDDIGVHRLEASGVVRLGIPPSIGCSIAASIVASYRQRCPAAHLYVMEAFSGMLAEWLEAGTVDVAILYDERRSPNMAVEPVLREDLFLVGRPDRLPAGDAVALEQIDAGRLVLPSKGDGLRRVIDAAFDASHVAFDSVFEVDSVATLKLLVENEDLLTILPYGAIVWEHAQGRLAARRLAAPGAVSALLVVGTALSKPITRSMRELLKVIDEEAGRFVQDRPWVGRYLR